ncbi:hypothetical protein QWJ26_23905 [Streptomyces sp. CSDS2]|uniref:hypothetical protein n=1 Tax=Streptomyces sp. CSDS2 TaxID=3055051 RepID=UPI0025B2202A|nr:hypothetical protein [Streptomyces sp. CSDS2]MDN3262791.1 hypothetical protein [Streptomyces sp. CSDS2]
MAKFVHFLAVAAGSAGILAAALATAPAASAATSQCAYAGPSGYSDLCVFDVSDGYEAHLFADEDLRDRTLDFNLICANGRWFGDGGSFHAYPYNQYSYVFKVGRQGSCFVRLIDRQSGKTWDTPSITR